MRAVVCAYSGKTPLKIACKALSQADSVGYILPTQILIVVRPLLIQRGNVVLQLGQGLLEYRPVPWVTSVLEILPHASAREDQPFALAIQFDFLLCFGEFAPLALARFSGFDLRLYAFTLPTSCHLF